MSRVDDLPHQAHTSYVRRGPIIPKHHIVARKIVALPTTDIQTMRLKARIYLWSEGTDFKTFAAKNEGDGSSEAVLVSLFRDLGVDLALDPVLAIVAELRATWHRLGKVIEETDRCEGPLFDEVQGVLDAAKAELLETPPTTLAGATCGHRVAGRIRRAQHSRNERRIHADADPFADLRPRGGAHMNAATQPPGESEFEASAASPVHLRTLSLRFST